MQENEVIFAIDQDGVVKVLYYEESLLDSEIDISELEDICFTDLEVGVYKYKVTATDVDGSYNTDFIGDEPECLWKLEFDFTH